MKNFRDNNLPINSTIKGKSAYKLSKKFGISNFSASRGLNFFYFYEEWFDKFKKRNNLIFRTISGESGSANLVEARNFQNSILNKINVFIDLIIKGIW